MASLAQVSLPCQPLVLLDAPCIYLDIPFLSLDSRFIILLASVFLSLSSRFHRLPTSTTYAPCKDQISCSKYRRCYEYIYIYYYTLIFIILYIKSILFQAQMWIKISVYIYLIFIFINRTSLNICVIKLKWSFRLTPSRACCEHRRDRPCQPECLVKFEGLREEERVQK